MPEESMDVGHSFDPFYHGVPPCCDLGVDSRVT